MPLCDQHQLHKAYEDEVSSVFIVLVITPASAILQAGTYDSDQHLTCLQAKAAQRAARAAKEETLLWKAEATRLQHELREKRAVEPGPGSHQLPQVHSSLHQHPVCCQAAAIEAGAGRPESRSTTAREVSHVYELMAMHCQLDQLQGKCSAAESLAAAAKRV